MSIAMPKVELAPRKAPRQRRSAATVEVILEAATRVLARESLEGFNTNRIAAVAGVSVGSIYQYFPNKAALVSALIDRAQAALAASLRRLLLDTEGGSLADSLRAVAALAVAQQYANPVLAAALDHEERRLPMQPRHKASEDEAVRCVKRLLRRHAGELPARLPASAARDCLVITKALVDASAGHRAAPPRDLQRRVVRALTGYLTLG